MDQLILAASDVVEAWDNHTLELDAAIRGLAKALGAKLDSIREHVSPELTGTASN